ncbi:hypothetical protein RND71_013602 [Anisodus tanguticus]|uniref:Uncharacterized protein n=1 Tax=Anisodus tanguticus TaxID=243964 RepID=A0AAE1VEA5_9SOLA|nr:hypothetical protein RND71_013602 [Anisodus tanguticus]
MKPPLQSVKREFHSTGVKRMGGHGHDEPFYLHAKHMYNLDRMSNQKQAEDDSWGLVCSIGVKQKILAHLPSAFLVRSLEYAEAKFCPQNCDGRVAFMTCPFSGPKKSIPKCINCCGASKGCKLFRKDGSLIWYVDHGLSAIGDRTSENIDLLLSNLVQTPTLPSQQSESLVGEERMEAHGSLPSDPIEETRKALDYHYESVGVPTEANACENVECSTVVEYSTVGYKPIQLLTEVSNNYGENTPIIFSGDVPKLAPVIAISLRSVPCSEETVAKGIHGKSIDGAERIDNP